MAIPEHADARTVRTLRVLLIAGAVAAAGVTLLLPGDAALAQDAQLLLVLQAMALIKAALLAGVGWALWLRARWPLPRSTRLVYLTSIWLMAGATGAIWRGDAIALAALAFHLGLAALAITAWRDRMSRSTATRAKHTDAAPAAPKDTAPTKIQRAA